MGMIDLIRFLSDNRISYVLVGGLAVALRGYQRVTMDVDVVLAMDDDNVQRFIRQAESAGLQPVVPVPIRSFADPAIRRQWYYEKHMLAFGLRHPSGTSTVIDVLIDSPISYEELQRESSTVAVGPFNVPVASIRHLIAMKQGTGRNKDQIDIEALEKIQSGGACS